MACFLLLCVFVRVCFNVCVLCVNDCAIACVCVVCSRLGAFCRNVSVSCD